MPMQPARALEQQVDGGNLRNHEIEIQVQALFDDLCRHQYGAMRAVRICVSVHRACFFALAELAKDFFFPLPPPHLERAGMEEQALGVLQVVSQVLIDLDGAVDRIADDGGAAAMLQLLAEGGGQGLQIGLGKAQINGAWLLHRDLGTYRGAALPAHWDSGVAWPE